MSATTAPVSPATSVAPPPSDRAGALAADRAASFPVPTGREEAWRFTPLEPLRQLIEGSPATGPEPAVDWTAAGADVAVVERDDPRLGSVLEPVDRISAMVAERADSALAVTVPAGAEAEVVIQVAGRGGTSYGYVLIDVAAGAKATVVLDHTGTGALAADVEIRVGDAASLIFASVQDWDDGTVHASHHHARVGRDAQFTSVVVTLGGDVVRIVPTVTYDGPGGNAELFGVYFADAGQHLEHRLFVDHAVPHCRSRVTYKGALQGAGSHTVWVGDVLIRAAAVGTDTYELNRNLVLSEGARADSVPNLEIETGQITGAGHASATGRFDDEQLFYLMSRGLPAVDARRLVVLGFFGEIIEEVPIPALRDRLLRAVAVELGYDQDLEDDA
ncbi:MAG: Fe-S cluster assembly protein SufD [Candidatus Nanopelagicales bacterium]